MGREAEGERRLVARRISFSVRARWRAAFKRSLSDCSVCVLDSRTESFVSSSLTWRSLRSRNARWLREGGSSASAAGLDGVAYVRCAVLCLASALGGCQAVLLLAAAACLVVVVLAAVVEVGAEARVYAADGHGRMRCCVVGRAVLGRRQAVGEAKGIVRRCIQDGFHGGFLAQHLGLVMAVGGFFRHTLTMLCAGGGGGGGPPKYE
jgi:hypothetical protein